MSARESLVAYVADITQRYGKMVGLDHISIDLPAGRMVGLIGPDGVGKSSLLSMIAGARQIQSGRVIVLDNDMADPRRRAKICPRIAYMPQGLGKNLYADLSVRENIEFFGRLFGQSRAKRDAMIAELLWSTGFAPFSKRMAKKLSGGMGQKLGLCCCLIHDPDLLILDEPTTGVDPLSRRRFWELIDQMRSRRKGMSVVVATANMEEAERFDWLVAMNAGRMLGTGTAADLKAKTNTSSLEDAFIALLPEQARRGHKTSQIPPRRIMDADPVIVARDLTCRFGDFTAVDKANFTIERGEIFGFVGSNGCGKSTTMKMLTGLLPPSEGAALLFGKPLDPSDTSARYRVGYMSQSFSLYTELTVQQNLELHAHLFHIPAQKARARIAALVDSFGLKDYFDQRTLDLPLGIRQRVALALAIVHEPEILILDEPTSGEPVRRTKQLYARHRRRRFVQQPQCRYRFHDRAGKDHPCGFLRSGRRRHGRRQQEQLIVLTSGSRGLIAGHASTMARLAESLMMDGGCLLTVTFYGAEKVVEEYNLMGPVKSAIDSCVRYMAAELGQKRIRVHALSPGPLQTRAASGIASFDELLERARARAPEHRFVSIQDVGNLAAFLVSDSAAALTGNIEYVDAGYHIVG